MTSGSSIRVAGVDGCRGGWVVATGPAEALPADGPVTVEVVADAGTLIGRLDRGELAMAAIDMPIGLSDTGPRRCDVEARAVLGARRSTVFPAPVRATLGAADYAEACARSRAATGGKALSLQAFHLLPKIATLDRLVSPQRDDVVESHPELAFVRLAGGGSLAPKATVEGREQRVALVRRVVGDVDPLVLARSAGAPLADVLDALALLATARRLVDGSARMLGNGERDSTGRPMRIAW